MNDNEQDNANEVVDTEVVTNVSVGQTLKNKREALGLSIGDVTDRLNLPVKYVEALEEGNYSELPNQVFLQGYMKSYAKLLDLDVEPLLENIRSVVDIPKAKPALKRDIKPLKPIKQSYGFDISKLIKAALILLVLGLGWWFFFGGDKAADEKPETSESGLNDTYFEGTRELEDAELTNDVDTGSVKPLDLSTESVATASVATVDALSAAATLTTNQAADATVLAGEALLPTKDERLAARTEKLKESLTQESAVTVIDNSKLEKIDSDGDDIVVLQYLEDSWTEIYDVNDKRLVYATKGAGQRLQVKGKAPFYVKLGRATSVIASFNGEPVSIVAKNEASAASFVLGK